MRKETLRYVEDLSKVEEKAYGPSFEIEQHIARYCLLNASLEWYGEM